MVQQLAEMRARAVELIGGGSCPHEGFLDLVRALVVRGVRNSLGHFRAGAMKRQGLRERLVPTSAAAGAQFDHGLNELCLEPFDAPDDELPANPRARVAIARPAARAATSR